MKKGVCQHRLILETLAHHFHEIKGTLKDSEAASANLNPIGALIISMCAVSKMS